MTVSATVPQAVPCVNPAPVAYDTSGLRGLVIYNPYRTLGLRFLEVAAFEAAAGRVTPAELAYIEARATEIDAEIALKARVVSTHCALTSSDFRKLGAESYAQWQHSRLARSAKRARKTAATCGNCKRIGRPCAWHQGGAK